MNLSDCQLTVIGHTHGASTFAKCVLPYFLHCIASVDDTFVCNTGKVCCIPETRFLSSSAFSVCMHAYCVLTTGVWLHENSILDKQRYSFFPTRCKESPRCRIHTLFFGVLTRGQYGSAEPSLWVEGWAVSVAEVEAMPRGTMGRLSTTECTYLPTYFSPLLSDANEPICENICLQRMGGK